MPDFAEALKVHDGHGTLLHFAIILGPLDNRGPNL